MVNDDLYCVLDYFHERAQHDDHHRRRRHRHHPLARSVYLHGRSFFDHVCVYLLSLNEVNQADEKGFEKEEEEEEEEHGCGRK